mgnify:FL=1
MKLSKDSKIYVAGHSGFLGSRLYKKLITDGYTKVYAFDRNELDLTSQADTLNLFKEHGFDFLFLCAAKCGGLQANLDDPYGHLMDNLEIQNSLIEASIKTKVKKVLFIGSNCIYPKNAEQPFKEECMLESPVEPTNEGYSLAKIAGLKLCEYANRLYGKNHNKDLHLTRFISLIPCNIYGPQDDFDLHNSHVMAALVRKFVEATELNSSKVELWGNGNTRREFLYVDDLVDSMIWSMSNLEYTEKFLNVGSGIDVDILTLSNIIKDVCGFKGEIECDLSKPMGMERKCLDVTKINHLGWSTKTDLRQGIKNTVEYYKTISSKL